MSKNKVKEETHKRSIIKALSWRLFGLMGTVSIVFLFTRKLSLSLGIGAFEMIIKMILYYFHERLWSKVSWGCIKHPLSQIHVKRELDPEDMNIIQDKLKKLGYVD